MINEGSVIFVELIMFPKYLLKFKLNSGDLLKSLLAEKQILHCLVENYNYSEKFLKMR